MTLLPELHHPGSRQLRQWAVLVAMLLALTGSTGRPTIASEIAVGGAGTRGFFTWAALGSYAWVPPLQQLPAGLDLPLRLEGLFANRENITNLVFAVAPTVRWQPPGFAGNDFAPYLSTGPAFHLQNTWSDLKEFGGVESNKEAVLKWHVFLGTTLVRGERADLIVETRYTMPSDINFDYLELAVRFHP